MNKKPFVINLKSGEEQTAIQLAQKLNSLKGVLNPDVLDGELLRKSEFEDFKNSVTKGIQGTEDRINYNNRNGRKTLSDMRWHGGGGGGSSNLLVQSVNGFAGNVNNNILSLSTTNSNGSVLIANNGAISQDSNLFWNFAQSTLKLGGDQVATGDNQTKLTVAGTINDYLAASVQNKSNGDSASTDFYVSADNDGPTLIGHYTDMGIWGSGFISSAIGNVKTVSLNAGGSGYTANDVLTIVSGDSNATVTVLTVNGSGVILTIQLSDNGTGYSTGSGFSTSGGTGTGGKVNVLTLLDNSIYSANDSYLYSSGGNLIISTDSLAKEIVFAVAGEGATNEMGRFTATQFKVGKTGTTLGSIFFSGNTSTGITLQGQAVGSSSVLTLPVATDTLVGKATSDALTNKTYNGLGITTTTGFLVITNGKTLAVEESITLKSNGINFSGGQLITFSATNSLAFTTTGNTSITLPTTGTLANRDVAQTFTGAQTFTNAVNYTNNAITASGNAATVPVTARVNTVTNNSAATLTVTLATASAVDGQLQLVRVLDFSGVAQTITWVNTENSTVTAPTTSNGSTTLPVTVGFQYNNATSKWRCIANA